MYVRQIQQISESHCGPAVLQMLLDSIGVVVTQNEIVAAAGAEKTLDEEGVRIEQLAHASHVLAPQTSFWQKYNATLDDIRYLLHRGIVVGVEWKGLFYDSEDEEDEDGDYGHFSVIAHLDEQRQALVIVDPYKDFANQDRIFPIATFMRRWWDENEIVDPFSGKKQIVEDRHALFFVTAADEILPSERSFQRT
jgi:ABC-type bacteriocin/lantibiotic exporter with double-glycine peptidase domain